MPGYGRQLSKRHRVCSGSSHWASPRRHDFCPTAVPVHYWSCAFQSGWTGNGFIFGVFNDLIVQQKESFQFAGRNRRPPLDRVNALLSFGYSLLANDLRSALESVGLDPYVGFLHADRPGRPSLALDLMEEFRASFVDRLVLNVINMKMARPEQFVQQPTGQVQMDPEARKTLITSFQQRKRETLTHPFLEEEMEIGLIFHAQARLLARHLRGAIDYYPAFLWR
jgi:CRISP-associated protein Cas1